MTRKALRMRMTKMVRMTKMGSDLTIDIVRVW